MKENIHFQNEITESVKNICNKIIENKDLNKSFLIKKENNFFLGTDYQYWFDYKPSNNLEKSLWQLILPFLLKAEKYSPSSINLFFNENDVPKGGKDHYEGLFNDYFKMTYGSEMDFISFKVESLIVPPEKTNQDKFFELFKKKVDEKNN